MAEDRKYVKTFYISDKQWNELKEVAQLTDKDLIDYKSLTEILHKVVPHTKNAVGVELYGLDTKLVDVSEVWQYIQLIKLSKEKEMNKIFYPAYREKKNFLKMAEIKRNLTVPKEGEEFTPYGKLSDDIEVLNSWLEFWERIHWVLKERIKNLRTIHGSSIE